MNTNSKSKPWREFQPGEVEAAHTLYLKHGPARLDLVVREMIQIGKWKQFRVSDLCGRRKRNFAGLIRLHGWDDEWQRIQEAAAEAVAAEQENQEKSDEIPPETAHLPSEPTAAAPPACLAGTPTPAPAIDFPSWLEAGRPDWEWRNGFQNLIYGELDQIERQKRSRLMIFMPPRHGKSELVTVRYAAWRLLHDPSLRIIVSSYNQRLANRFSRYIKSVYRDGPQIEMSEFAPERDLVLNAMDEWETPSGGGVKAVGAGAGITGFGANLIIIDDPIKSRADAESRNNRDRVWEWFTDDLMTRLEPNGAVILIQTRWHEDDLAGRLLRKVESGESGVESDKSKTIRKPRTRHSRLSTLDSNQWTVVSLPALAEGGNAGSLACNAGSSGVTAHSISQVDQSSRSSAFRGTLAGKAACAPADPLGRSPGEALWPERFPVSRLLARKREMGSYSFAALYQQRPVPSSGALFKREWFSRIVAAAPAGLRWYRGYDLAVSTKTSADYTASFRVALDKKTGDMYIADGYRARIEFPEQRKYIVGRIRDERSTEHGIEEALHGQAFVQELWREERLSSSAFRGVRVTADKFTRALAWANRAEAGKVVLIQGAWIPAFLDELLHFPNAAHDDQVDAVSLAVQMIETKKNQLWAF